VYDMTDAWGVDAYAESGGGYDDRGLRAESPCSEALRPCVFAKLGVVEMAL
jgi:hypothetical protein